MAKRDYYEILGLQKDADLASIKKEYRKLALKYHPDKNPGDTQAEEKFKEAAEAYEVLSDPDKRARYDRFGHSGVGDSGGFSGGGMTMEDIFRQFGNLFDDAGSPFDSFFGGERRYQTRSSADRGSNIRIKIALTLEEIAQGVSKKIKIKKDVNCSACNGSGAKDSNSVSSCPTCKGSGYVRQVRSTFLGQMATTSSCPTCNGSGKKITSFCQVCKGNGTVKGDETIEINIPAGVEDGMQLSMRGKGNKGRNNGPSGDLVINIEEKTHSEFVRDGKNIIYETNLNFSDMVLGTNITVPTLTGKVKINIPPGTPAGKIFRLSGKGVPVLNSYDVGDQLIHVSVWVPKKVSQEEREMLTTMKSSPNFEPGEKQTGRGFFERMREFFN